ncbi:cytoskeletal protein RodZ [Nakamurella sp. UYEF19]|uniref:hypothetical protein n=1 Tax=Nakamurella sp. UYEF19 TaxID=1756392 RepID=UPI003395D7D4
MKIRTLALAGVLGVSLLIGGCATSIAGQAEVAAGAVASGSAPTSDGSTGSDSTTSTQSPETPSADQTSSDTGSPDATAEQSTGDQNSAPTTGNSSSGDSSTSEPSTSASDRSVAPTSIPGLSADCNKVLAAITAFSSVLQGGTGDMNAKITQSAVDDALKQLPASGLPERPQADINVLRATVSAAAGKTIAELGMTMTDGKVVAALQDLSSWATTTCA